MRQFSRSFSSGELTPELYGRIDLAKAQEGLAVCRNFLTLPHGPAVNRTGTLFVSAVKNVGTFTRVIQFSYNNTQNFAIEMGAGYFRFHSLGGTLLYATPAAWSSSTAYLQGDMASSGGVNYYCLIDNTNNAPPNATYWYALPSSLIYEIPNPYAAADLASINYVQSADTLTLTHQNYPPMELRRYGATNWQLIKVQFTPIIEAPGLGVSQGAGTPVMCSYVVTEINLGARWRVESQASAVATCSNDLSLKGAYNLIQWAPGGPSVSSYNIYKLVNSVYSYIGSATGGTSFKDTGSITPITTTNPPTTGSSAVPLSVTASAYSSSGQPSQPTATPTPGGVSTTTYQYVITAVDALGNESTHSATCSCTNDLTLATHYNTITWPNVAGAVRYNVYEYLNGIWGYIGQAATNSFVDNYITPNPSITPPLVTNPFVGTGNFPGAVSYYEQRRTFAGPANAPQSVWMTRSGTESDMNYTIPTKADNRIYFRIAAREASAILHVCPVTSMILLTATCEFRVTSTDTGAITPSSISVRPQSYIGSSYVRPVIVGNTVLFAAARGGHVREMSYNWQAQAYLTNDVSLLATHLFDYNSLTDMAYCRGPIPTLWATSSNGQLLGMTYVPEQQIAAWHRHDTGGQDGAGNQIAPSDIFESICTVTENNEDMLYCVVNRTINGAQQRYVERLQSRKYANVASSWFVDCGATYFNSGTFTVTGSTMTVTMANHGLSNGTYNFAFSDPGYGPYPAGTAYAITVVDVNTFTMTVATTYSASGTVTQQITTLSGLTWLNGMTVNILADGAVCPSQIVTNNAITLPSPAAQVTVGLPITAQIQTLPAAQQIDAAYAQGRPKDISKSFLRVYRSSGIWAGPSFTSLVPYRQRSTEPYGSPPNLVSDEVEVVLNNVWGSSGQVCIQQTDPLPLDIASMTIEVSVGGG